MHEDSDSKDKGAHSIKKSRKPKKSLRPTVIKSRPTDLMDPDQANTLGALDRSRSIRILIKRPAKREDGPGLGQPDPSVYIKGLTPGFLHFLGSFLFLLLFSCAVLSSRES